jgi:hypothetical protein
LLLAVVLSAGCEQPSVQVTGQPGSSTLPAPRTQSETIINVSYLSEARGVPEDQVISVSYNDDFDTASSGTQATIIQTSQGRTVYSGASTLGWSYSTDGAQSWTYGGQVLPDSEHGVPAAVLWGDPSITHSRVDQHFVFIGNLMIPVSKYPADGISGFVTAYIGGGCVAKSSDGGRSFALYQCMQSTSTDARGDIYDGGTMEAGNHGEIYVAWINLSAGTIDVWSASSETATFAMLPTPFPGQTAAAHPLLRYDPDSGSLYALAPITLNADTDSAALFINRWDGSHWGTAKQASDPDLRSEPSIAFTGGAVRRGQPYSFDVGPGEGLIGSTGPSSVRLLYTAQDSTGRYFLRGGQCDAALSTGCGPVDGWGTGASPGGHVPGDQFSPLVRLARPAFSPLEPYEWKAVWSSREQDPSGNTFIVVQSNLVQFANGDGLALGEPLFGPLTPCPSSGSNYWGDYDDLQNVAIASGSLTPDWITTFSDSSQGCQYQWDFTSYHVHLSDVRFQ